MMSNRAKYNAFRSNFELWVKLFIIKKKQQVKIKIKNNVTII